MEFYISRFKGMERREFEVEVVTPLFLGGADTRKAELRVPSIKGALRFWWRALYGSDDLETMIKRESEIFGSTDKKASFSIHLENTNNLAPVLRDLPTGIKVPTRSKGKTFKISIIEYLAYGLCEYKKNKKRNVYMREHFPQGTKFNINLTFYNTSYQDQVINSLKALVIFGGIGARSRNGFGSILIKDFSLPLQPEDNLKSFTSFSRKSRLFSDFPEKDNWEDALSEIGKVYREARLSLEKKHSFLKRPLIAKPLIVKGEVSINDRHSKPYFLHVNKLKNGKYQGQILFMPYNYYDRSQKEEYFKTCTQMNQKISELSGGSK